MKNFKINRLYCVSHYKAILGHAGLKHTNIKLQTLQDIKT